jgi:hypothetical protein
MHYISEAKGHNTNLYTRNKHPGVLYRKVSPALDKLENLAFHINANVNAKMHLLPSSSLNHVLKVRCSEASNRIPARSGIPASIRHDWATVRRTTEATVTITAGASTGCNVVQRVGVRVQPRVQEAHGRLTSLDTGVVEQGNNTGESRCRARCTVNLGETALLVDSVVLALGGDIGESTAVGVEQTSLASTELGQIGANSIVLPGRPFPEVGETAGREVDGLFGGGVGCCADGCDPRAGGGELRGKVSGVLAVVGLTSCADAGVA